MKLRNFCLMFFFLPALSAHLRAVEIEGKVVEVARDLAKVETDSDLLPVLGDKVAFSFAIPGLAERAAVGSGTVSGLEGDLVLVRIEKTTGKIVKGNLATLTSDRPTKKQAVAAPQVNSVPPVQRQDAAGTISNSIGMKLTLVPAGEFLMGSGESAEATAAFFNKIFPRSSSRGEGKPDCAQYINGFRVARTH